MFEIRCKSSLGKVGLMLLVLLFVQGLFGQGCTKTATPAHELIVGIEKSPRSRHPVFGTDAYSQWINNFIYEGLVKIGEDLTVQPQLAVKWSTPNDMTYRFELPTTVTFHNGKKMTCEDVQSSIMRYKQKDSPFSIAFSRIQNATCRSATEVEVKLNEPFAAFLTDFVLIRIFPKEEAAQASAHIKNPIGTGPFVPKLWTEQKITLSRHDGYHGTKPSFQDLTFKVIGDAQTRLLSLQNESIDVVINALTPTQVESAKQKEKFGVLKASGITYQYISLNAQHKALKDKRVRKALAYGINRDEIVKLKLKGYATLAKSMLSEKSFFFHKNVRDYPYNPEKARKLLAQAGYSQANPLKLEFKTSTDTTAVSVALIIKEQLAKIGVRLNLKSLEWATFYADIKKGNYQIHSLRRIGLTEPNAYYDFFHSSQFAPEGQNRGRFAHKEIDSLSLKASRILDPQKRKKIYSRIQDIVADEVPYVNLWHNDNTAVFLKKRIKNLRLLPNGSLECLLDVTKT